jgi:hypothetical protein
MHFRRVIFAALMCVGLIVSLAPARPAPAAPAERDAHACCKKELKTTDGSDDSNDSGARHQDKCCGGTGCAMLCCRLIPAQADSIPPLAGQVRVTIPLAVVPPATLHSLTDPDTIFHPPRA